MNWKRIRSSDQRIPLWLAAGLLLGGCATSAPPVAALPALAPAAGLRPPEYVSSVLAQCPVPEGWKPEPLKVNSRHTHQVWISPSGNTAYGVIHFNLPLPVGPDLTLQGFLAAMRKSEGQAILVEKHEDQTLPGIRFIAEGGRYRIRAELIVRGWEAWTVYAGTLVAKPIVENELELAQHAVQHTRVGAIVSQPQVRAAAD